MSSDYITSSVTESLKLNKIKETLGTSVRMLRLIWQVDKLITSGLALTTAVPGILPFINVYIYKQIIDLVVTTGSTADFDIRLLIYLLAARVVTYFLQEIAFISQLSLERLLWLKVPIHLNNLFFHKVAGLDFYYFEDSNFKDLLERVRDSYQQRPQQLVANIFYALQSVLKLVIALVAIAQLNWLFTVLIALVAIPEFINQTQQSKTIWGIWAENSPVRKRFSYLSDLLQNPAGIKEIKIFRLRTRFLREIKKIQEDFYSENKVIIRKYLLLNVALKVLSTAVFIGLEIYVIWRALSRQITVGDVGFYTGVVSNFQDGLSGLFRNMNRIFENSLYVQSVFDVLDLPRVLSRPVAATKLNLTGPPTVEFHNVDFRYHHNTRYILKNFSLRISGGEKIAFVGENGSGKTTLIKLLARFYDPTAGKITINGRDLKDIDLLDWYQYLGVLFQDFNKYQHTLKENIHFGEISREPKLESIIEAAVAAGADEVAGRLQYGYEQVLGKTFAKGIELSGGQWQRVALARAYFRNAPILILDEPTSAIDPRTESEIFTKVENLAKNKTVLIVSHRFSTVRGADKIYVIHEGQIVESGSHHDLMAAKGRYAALFNLQASGYR